MGLGLGFGFGGGGAGSWAPTSLSGGVFLWLRADLGTTESGGAGTGVSGWADQSGNGDSTRNMAQPTAGRRPTLNASSAALNNQKSLGGGATKGMVSGTWSALAQPFSICWSGIASTTAEQLLIQGASTNVFVESTVTDKHPYMYAGSSLISGTGDLTTKHVGVAEFNGASSKIYLSALTPVATGAAGAASLLDLSLMNITDGGALPWLGELHEFVIVPRVLGADLTTLMSYMGARIGQSIGA